MPMFALTVGSVAVAVVGLLAVKKLLEDVLGDDPYGAPLPCEEDQGRRGGSAGEAASIDAEADPRGERCT